jgi:hypothetical protein
VLRREVDVDDAEALRVSERPLEVVEQRPAEVAAQVDAVGDRALAGGEMLAQVPVRCGSSTAPLCTTSSKLAPFPVIDRRPAVVAGDARQRVVE